MHTTLFSVTIVGLSRKFIGCSACETLHVSRSDVFIHQRTYEKSHFLNEKASDDWNEVSEFYPRNAVNFPSDPIIDRPSTIDPSAILDRTREHAAAIVQRLRGFGPVIHLEMGRASFASARRDDPLSLSMPFSFALRFPQSGITCTIIWLKYGYESRDYRAGVTAVVLFTRTCVGCNNDRRDNAPIIKAAA